MLSDRFQSESIKFQNRSCRYCIFKEYDNISGRKNVYIYVFGEVVDDVFSTMTITTFRCTIAQNVLLLNERARSNCLLQILWNISTIDVDSVERRHRYFAKMAKTFIQTINSMLMYQVEQTYIFMYPVKLLIMYFLPSQLQILGVQFCRTSLF